MACPPPDPPAVAPAWCHHSTGSDRHSAPPVSPPVRPSAIRSCHIGPQGFGRPYAAPPDSARSTAAGQSRSHRAAPPAADRRPYDPDCPGAGLSVSTGPPGWVSYPAKVGRRSCPVSSAEHQASPPIPPPAPSASAPGLSASEPAPTALGLARPSRHATANSGRGAGSPKASILAPVVTSTLFDSATHATSSRWDEQILAPQLRPNCQ